MEQLLGSSKALNQAPPNTGQPSTRAEAAREKGSAMAPEKTPTPRPCEPKGWRPKVAAVALLYVAATWAACSCVVPLEEASMALTESRRYICVYIYISM